MGDSGQGLTHGVAGAMLNTALIMGEKHPWQELYAPSRVPLKAAKNFLLENTTALKSFVEYVAPGELPSLDELARGQGAIVRQGLAKVAAYRDVKGVLHLNSAMPAAIFTGTVSRLAGTVPATVRCSISRALRSTLRRLGRSAKSSSKVRPHRESGLLRSLIPPWRDCDVRRRHLRGCSPS
jgi:hypothetical protein